MIELTLRSIWLAGGALAAGLLAVARLTPGPAPLPPTTLQPLAPSPRAAAVASGVASAAVLSARRPYPALADSVVATGLRLRGTDYCYAGTTPAGGFDCSGFVTYCFAQVGIAVPHSSGLQAQVGRAVARAEARPGDIVIFAGTAPGSRSPGHAGIVISRPGGVLSFVHSSSARKERGVKVSQVDSTRYETRFLGVRRLIE